MSDEKVTSAVPHNVEAERAVLGSLMLNAGVYFRVSPLVGADDFFREGHRLVYSVIAEMVAGGGRPDLLTVIAALDVDGLKRAGGRAYVASLVDDIPAIANVEKYAEIVARQSKRRRLIAAANAVMNRAMEDDTAPETIAAEALAAFTPTATREDAQARPFGEVVKAAYQGAENRRTEDRSLALTTGMYELDAFGVIRRTFIAVGSGSGHGKSAFAVNLAAGLAGSGYTVGFMTLESTVEEIAWRYVSATTGIPHGRVQDFRYLQPADFERLARAEMLAKKLPIFITRSVRTIAAIDAEARRLKAVHGLDALLIDYIQLVRFPGGPRDREERMAEISAWLLNIALDLGIAVVVTSQVNKDRLERKDGRLYPSDLKYAAAIAESARVVVLFQRPHVDDPNKPACHSLVQVAKANEGRTGDYVAHFSETTQKFTDGNCAVNDCRHCQSTDDCMRQPVTERETAGRLFQ